MRALLEDLRYGFRILLKNPGFAITSVLCLALGAGATTAIFTVVRAVVLRPLPYTEPQRLVRIYSEFLNFPGGGLRRFWVSAPEFLDMRREAKSWESLDAWVNGGVNLAGATEPVRVTACNLSGGLLKSLGVSPALGRLITPQDDVNGAPRVAVISDGLWQRAFGGDARIAGRQTLLNGNTCTIIGVMPRGFQFPPGEVDPPEVWVPLQIDLARPGGRGSHNFSLLGRLRPGVTLARARDEMSQLVSHWGESAAPRTHAMNPKSHPVVSYPLHEEVVGGVRPAMLMLLGAVGFVLLIACVNVANLLLARAESRQREIAIRSAMGAALPRLLRQFVTEGILLSMFGAGLGLALALGGLRLIKAASPGSIPRVDEIGIDMGVLLFTLAVSAVTGIVFGLAPIAHIAIRNLHESLKSAAGRTTASAGAQRFRQVLVVGELGLALVLLIGTGLMLRAFWKLQEVDTGMNPRGVLSMRISLPRALYPDNQGVASFWSRLEARIAALPGVQVSSIMSGLPPARPMNANDTQIEGWVQKPGGPIQNIDFWQVAGKRYFETLGVRLIEGRLFDDRDGPGAPDVVIINQTMARTYWPGESAIGRRVRPGFTDPWCTVAGVVADVKNAGLDKPAGTELFLPMSQPQAAGQRSAYLVMRTTGDPARLIRPAREQIRALDPTLAVAGVRTMDDVLAAAQSRPRFLTLLLTIFAGVALVLAAVGLYGVISYSVAQRTSEIGIRMAMGARPRDVLRMIMSQGLRLGLLGVGGGGLAALALTRLIRGLLFGVSAFDPGTFAAMAVLLVGVTLLACYLPARRATKVDPMIALRYE